jgi:hypothetical protein
MEAASSFTRKPCSSYSRWTHEIVGVQRWTMVRLEPFILFLYYQKVRRFSSASHRICISYCLNATGRNTEKPGSPVSAKSVK